MTVKLLGALLVIACCGGLGLKMAGIYRREITTLQGLEMVLLQMSSELQYRLTPLPTLCSLAAKSCSGTLSNALETFSYELDTQVSPDTGQCMAATLSRYPNLPPISKDLLQQFGNTAGRFDLEGQLTGIAYLHQECTRNLSELRKNRDARLRNYQTLGLCAGAALVILFI